MNNNSEVLNNDDVISLSEKQQRRFMLGDTLKLEQLLQEYRQYVAQNKTATRNKEIFEQGIECEILRHDSEHKGWRKGKIKFVIQFEPKEGENNCDLNSLDDIRQKLDYTN